MAAMTVMKRVNHIDFFLLLSLTWHYFWKSTFKSSYWIYGFSGVSMVVRLLSPYLRLGILKRDDNVFSVNVSSLFCFVLFRLQCLRLGSPQLHSGKRTHVQGTTECSRRKRRGGHGRRRVLRRVRTGTILHRVTSGRLQGELWRVSWASEPLHLRQGGWACAPLTGQPLTEAARGAVQGTRRALEASLQGGVQIYPEEFSRKRFLHVYITYTFQECLVYIYKHMDRWGFNPPISMAACTSSISSTSIST